MASGFTWQGLNELREALANLPDHLAVEAAAIIEETTASAEAEAASGYAGSQRAAKMARKLRHTVVRDGVSITGEVRNSSKLAYIFENGTQARHTDFGVDRGSIPPAHVFIPTMQRWRNRMYERLKDMMVREGLLVSGDAG